MDLGLSGRVAVVTGAGRGIGRSIAQTLAAEGAKVVAASRETDGLDGLADVTAVAADLTDPGAPAAVVRRALEAYGRIDVLVNNVGGVRMRLDGFPAVDDEAFRWALELNFFATLRMTRAAIVAMVEQGSGAVVNIASVNAFFQPDGATVDYGAAKAAVVNLTRQLGCEWARKGVRVNAIAPGWFPSEMTQEEMFDDESGLRFIQTHTPMARGGRPDELDGALLYLAGDASSFVTGQTLVVDGGWTAR